MLFWRPHGRSYKPCKIMTTKNPRCSSSRQKKLQSTCQERSSPRNWVSSLTIPFDIAASNRFDLTVLPRVKVKRPERFVSSFLQSLSESLSLLSSAIVRQHIEDPDTFAPSLLLRSTTKCLASIQQWIVDSAIEISSGPGCTEVSSYSAVKVVHSDRNSTSSVSGKFS